MKGIILSAILFASITTSAMANETKNLELKGDFKNRILRLRIEARPISDGTKGFPDKMFRII